MSEPLQTILSGRRISKQVESMDAGEDRILHILAAVDIEINRGETVAILGASGSGKSTLLALLAGLDTPSSGEIQLLDTRLDQLDEDGRAELRARYVGFVFQSFQLLPGLTAVENVMLPLELKADREARSKALEMLQRVNLGQRTSHYPRQLSGGEQQRVAIARAFVTQPALLFADEPTGNLDSHTGQHIIDLLLALNREHNTTLVLVTHDDNLSRQCQRRLYLDNGQLSEQS